MNRSFTETQGASREHRYPLAPTLIVPEDLNVSACAERMKALGTTAALVMDPWSGKSIDGIFTDRDLFLKAGSTGGLYNFWERPVERVMTRNVISLSLDEIHEAPKIMIEKGIHHLPIVNREKVGRDHVLGILTLDSFFRDGIRAPGAWRDFLNAPQLPPMGIGVLSHDRVLSRSIEQALTVPNKARVREVRKSELMTPTLMQALSENLRNLIIDVDDNDGTRNLAKFLKSLLATDSFQRILLLFTPRKDDAELGPLLRKLDGWGPFHIAPKPIDLSNLVRVFAQST